MARGRGTSGLLLPPIQRPVVCWVLTSLVWMNSHPFDAIDTEFRQGQDTSEYPKHPQCEPRPKLLHVVRNLSVATAQTISAHDRTLETNDRQPKTNI